MDKGQVKVLFEMGENMKHVKCLLDDWRKHSYSLAEIFVWFLAKM